MTPGFRQLLNRFAMPGFEHQIALSEILTDDDWKLSPKDGTVSFSGGQTYALQFLGTRSEATSTWMWAWANKEGIPAASLEAAKKVRQAGKKRSIGELEADTLDLDQLGLDGHTLALVATGVAGLPAYYRFPYASGVLYAAFAADALRLPAPDLSRLAHVIQEVVSRFDLDVRTAITAYLVERGAQVRSDKTTLMAAWADGRRLTADIDPQGRLLGLVPSTGEGVPERMASP